MLPKQRAEDKQIVDAWNRFRPNIRIRFTGLPDRLYRDW